MPLADMNILGMGAKEDTADAECTGFSSFLKKKCTQAHTQTRRFDNFSEPVLMREQQALTAQP